VLALCVGLLAAGRLRRRAWLGAGAAALAAALLAGPWWAWMARNGVATNAFEPVTLNCLLAQAGRLPAIAGLAAGALAGAWWAGLWLVVPAIALWGAFRGSRFEVRGLLASREAGWLLATALYLALMSAAYAFSTYVPYQQHVVSSIDRLALHVAPLAVVWLAGESDA
jgi:hypothetical protein